MSVANVGSPSLGGNNFILVLSFGKHCGSHLCIFCNASVHEHYSSFCNWVKSCISCCFLIVYLQYLVVFYVIVCSATTCYSEGLEIVLVSLDCLSSCHLPYGCMCSISSGSARLLLGIYWLNRSHVSPIYQSQVWIFGRGCFWVNDEVGSILLLLSETNSFCLTFLFGFSYSCFIFMTRIQGDWSIVWFMPWTDVLEVLLGVSHSLPHVSSTLFLARERMSLDILSEAISQNAIIWPALLCSYFLLNLCISFFFCGYCYPGLDISLFMIMCFGRVTGFVQHCVFFYWRDLPWWYSLSHGFLAT